MQQLRSNSSCDGRSVKRKLPVTGESDSLNMHLFACMCVWSYSSIIKLLFITIKRFITPMALLNISSIQISPWWFPSEYHWLIVCCFLHKADTVVPGHGSLWLYTILCISYNSRKKAFLQMILSTLHEWDSSCSLLCQVAKVSPLHPIHLYAYSQNKGSFLYISCLKSKSTSWHSCFFLLLSLHFSNLWE